MALHLRRLTVLCCLAFGLGAAEPCAWAGPQYDQALVAYERVEYAETVRLLENALPNEALGTAELERAYFLLGSALLGNGQAEHAARAFQTLVALRPDYRAERDASPKVIEGLRRARTAVGTKPPEILPDGPAVATGDSLLVKAEMVAATVLSPAVEYRLVGETPVPGRAPSRLRVRCEASKCEGKLPANTETYRLGFLTPEGAFALPTSVLRVVGDKRDARPAGSSTPIYKKWWLWTIVGAVVVGGVAGMAVGLTLSSKANHSIDFSVRKDCGGSATCPLWTAP